MMTDVATPTTARPGRARFLPTRENHTVTTLELFFDLVFVFAITQVTALMAEDIGPRGLLRGLVQNRHDAVVAKNALNSGR